MQHVYQVRLDNTVLMLIEKHPEPLGPRGSRTFRPAHRSDNQENLEQQRVYTSFSLPRWARIAFCIPFDVSQIWLRKYTKLCHRCIASSTRFAR